MADEVTDDAQDDLPAAADGAAAGGEDRLFAGKYKDLESLEAGYVELAKKLGERPQVDREKLAEEIRAELRAAVPETADLYTFVPPDGLVPEGMAFSMDESNSVFGKWRTLAHEIGLTPEQFNAATALYVENELSMLPNKEKEMEKLGENAQARLDRLDMWAMKHLTPEGYAAINEVSSSAGFIMAMEEMMRLARDPSLETSDTKQNGAMTREELEQMMKDPRYRSQRHRDPTYVEKVQEGFRRLQGAS